MTRIFVYEALSANAPELAAASVPGSREHEELHAAGVAMRDAIAGDLARLPGVTVTVAKGRQGEGPAAPLAGESAVDFVRRQSRLHDLSWVVAPETDGLLARLQEAVGDERWIGCSGPAIRLASSKSATCAALARAGILTPLAFATGHAGPWIVKPDDGAGTMDTRFHATRGGAEADLARRERAVLEPFVAGEALSISLVVGPVLARPIAFNRQRLHVDAEGFFHDLGVQPATIDPADRRAASLRSLAAEVAAALPGLRGYVGIDLVWNEGGRPVVIEVNPRVTCAYVGLSAILHRNLAADILEAHSRSPARRAQTDVAA